MQQRQYIMNIYYNTNTGKSFSMRCNISIVVLCSEYRADRSAAKKNIHVAGDAG